MLRYNIDNPDPDHLGIIITTLDGDADGQQIATAWIAIRKVEHGRGKQGKLAFDIP